MTPSLAHKRLLALGTAIFAVGAMAFGFRFSQWPNYLPKSTSAFLTPPNGLYYLVAIDGAWVVLWAVLIILMFYRFGPWGILFLLTAPLVLLGPFSDLFFVACVTGGPSNCL